jgi:hypothetical protein
MQRFRRSGAVVAHSEASGTQAFSLERSIDGVR